MGDQEHEVEFMLGDVDRFQEGDKVRSNSITIRNFRFRILVFPFGTKQSRGPATLSAFIEADPDPEALCDQDRWVFPSVKYFRIHL